MKRYQWALLAPMITMATPSIALAEMLTCEEVTSDALGVPDVTITEVISVEQGQDSPVDQCRIRAQIGQRVGDDGRDYAISFELALPDDWNGDFVHQFNGGNDGAVSPATGWALSGDRGLTALGRGYAVVSSDAGHDAASVTDAGLAGGARFGFDAEARSDYGYGAVAKLNPVAVAMVEGYYGKDIGRSYGIGGSNGGRHAMVAAARMPEAFDGLLIGYPGFNLPKAAVQHALDLQAFTAINGDVRQAFSQEDLTLVSDAVLKACDGLDGLEDGLVSDTDACQSAFDIKALQCTDGQNSACLDAAKIEALTTVHAGPRNSAGEQLYSEWAWDTGIASGDWRFWKLQSQIPPWDNLPLIATMGSASLAQIFTTPPTEVGGSPDELEQYLLSFDFDTDAPKIYATTEAFPESAMEFMTPPGVDDPELAAFRDAGGKMIIFHGVSDPVFSVLDITNWYEKLDANNGGNAEAFAMLYRIPGMGHGPTGPATEDYDFLSALVSWVEEGEAPGPVVAGVSAGNAEGQAALGDVTRKLCPYPQVARYTGGDESSADSFSCE